MYQDYIKETEGYDTLENEYGFVTYHVSPVTYVMDVGDIYILPDKRSGVGFDKMHDELIRIGTEQNCKKIVCCVETFQKNPERAMTMLLRIKFLFSHFSNGVMYFYKNVEESGYAKQ